MTREAQPHRLFRAIIAATSNDHEDFVASLQDRPSTCPSTSSLDPIHRHLSADLYTVRFCLNTTHFNIRWKRAIIQAVGSDVNGLRLNRQLDVIVVRISRVLISYGSCTQL